jgi:hypothetical protein
VAACHGYDLHYRTGFRGDVYAPVALPTMNFGLSPTGLERKVQPVADLRIMDIL